MDMFGNHPDISPFNTLGESVTNLLDSIVNNKPKRPHFNIGFIPEDDETVNYITSMKIREICSALCFREIHSPISGWCSKKHFSILSERAPDK